MYIYTVYLHNIMCTFLLDLFHEPRMVYGKTGGNYPVALLHGCKRLKKKPKPKQCGGSGVLTKQRCYTALKPLAGCRPKITCHFTRVAYPHASKTAS